MSGLGTKIMLAGLVLLAIGAAVRFLPAGAFSWFGHLPGDIRYERGPTRVYAPITSMILVSIALTIVVNVVGRWFGR